MAYKGLQVPEDSLLHCMCVKRQCTYSSQDHCLCICSCLWGNAVNVVLLWLAGEAWLI